MLKHPIDSWCRIDLAQLRPTQPAVGMIQVMQDTEHLKKYAPKNDLPSFQRTV
jgi:hypothetical protein